MKKKLVVVGAGPKALAIYAKAKVLGSLGFEVPEIIVIEKSEIAAHWTGKNGYTDGKGILGISPLKDIGYPYSSTFGKQVDEAMEKYSFITYLKEINKFTKWVDGGMMQITHSDFSRYLKWVANKLSIEPVYGEVVSLVENNMKWSVVYTKDNKEYTIDCDEVMATGPGEVTSFIDKNLKSEKIFDAKNFWLNINSFSNLKNKKIALIGGGISAGSIFESVISSIDYSSHIDWYTRRGIFTRSENFSNNQIFSHPEMWEDMSVEHRTYFVKGTDRGSVDSSTHNFMNRFTDQFTLVFGTPKSVYEENNKIIVSYINKEVDTKKEYDLLIVATGFDNMYFLSWLSDDFKIKNGINNISEEELSDKIEEDFTIENIRPKLCTPMIAWHKHGIGLSVLSCMSTLSDRILAPYVSK